MTQLDEQQAFPSVTFLDFSPYWLRGHLPPPPSGGKQTTNVNHSRFLTELMYCRRQRARGQLHRETEKTAGRLTNKITETLTPRKFWMYPRTLSHSHTRMSKQDGSMKSPSVRSARWLEQNSLWFWGLGFLVCKVGSFTGRWWTRRMVSALKALAFSQRNERKLAESDPICWFNKSQFCLRNVCISSMKTAIKTNFTAKLFPLEPKNECELLYVCFSQLSVSKLLYYYSKLNRSIKNWASNESVKLWVDHPCSFVFNVFWIFFWICS